MANALPKARTADDVPRVRAEWYTGEHDLVDSQVQANVDGQEPGGAAPVALDDAIASPLPARARRLVVARRPDFELAGMSRALSRPPPAEDFFRVQRGSGIEPPGPPRDHVVDADNHVRLEQRESPLRLLDDLHGPADDEPGRHPITRSISRSACPRTIGLVCMARCPDCISMTSTSPVIVPLPAIPNPVPR